MRNFHKEIADLQFEVIKLRRQLGEAVKVISSMNQEEADRILAIQSTNLDLSNHALWAEIIKSLDITPGSYNSTEFMNIYGLVVDSIQVEQHWSATRRLTVLARLMEAPAFTIEVVADLHDDGRVYVNNISTRTSVV